MAILANRFCGVIVVLCTFSVYGANTAAAQTKASAIAVVSLDTPRNPDAENIVLDTLVNANYDVISWEDLSVRLKAAQSPMPAPEISQKFTSMSTTISEGVEKFFYDSEKKSIAKLQPVFDMGMNHIDVLARRADYADQIFQAGLILIRAYDQSNQPENANAVMSLMIRSFPTQKFSATIIPPVIMKRLNKKREALGSDSTVLQLKTNQEQCVAYINGVAAPVGKDILVASDTNYYLRLDCGGSSPVVWKTKLANGARVTIPLTDRDLSDISLSSDDFHDRKKVELALGSMMYWANMDRIVGVSQQFGKQGNVLVVRMDRGKGARWSDGAAEEDVYRALVKVFPELDGQVSLEPEKESEPFQTDWLGWGFVGGGITVATVSTILLIPTIERRDELECAAGTRTEGCGGVEARDPTSDAYKTDTSAVDTRLIVSYVMYGVAAGAVGYGVYRLLSFEPDTIDDEISTSAVVTPDYVGAVVHARF